jgi:hypothetical protein
MNLSKILRITLSIIIGEVALVLATTLAQEVLFDGIGLSSPPSELLFGGVATFVAAIIAGIAARFSLNQQSFIIPISMSILIATEMTYLILANRTNDPVWFDILAGSSLIIGVWIGFRIKTIFVHKRK